MRRYRRLRHRSASASLPTARSMTPIPSACSPEGWGRCTARPASTRQIGNAIGGVAGPLVAARVAAGFVPVPLTSPPLASIPPITMGALDFDVPAVSISGARPGSCSRATRSASPPTERRHRSVHVRVDEGRPAVCDDADHHRHSSARRHDLCGDRDGLARSGVEHRHQNGSGLRLHRRGQPDEPPGLDDRGEHLRDDGDVGLRARRRRGCPRSGCRCPAFRPERRQPSVPRAEVLEASPRR